MSDYENDYEEPIDEIEEIDDEEELLNKIAANLDGEEVESEVESETSAPPAQEISDDYKVKVKVNGVEQEVSLAELRNGYQRQSDYTAKTQELANQRHEVEAQRSQYEQYVNSIPMLAMVAQNNVNAAQAQLYSPEMQQLAVNDPAEYVAQKAKIEATIVDNARAYQQMQEQYQQYQTNLSYEHNSFIQDQLAKSNEILTKELPGWADGSIRDPLINYGRQSGFSDEELGSVVDHRQLMILNKARLYDELVKRGPQTKQVVQKAPPKTIKPGTTQASEADDYSSRKAKAIARAKRGDESALIDLMAGLLDD